MFKLLLINATGKEWKTMQERINHIARVWALAKNAPKLLITTESHDVGIPHVDNDGYINRTWLDENISNPAKARDFNAVMVIFSTAQGKKYKFKRGLRGRHLRDKDFIGETWLVTDEKTTYKYPSGKKMLRFDKTATHELSHMVSHNLGVTDRTHEYEEKYEDIERCFREYDWNEWNRLWATYVARKNQLANLLMGKPRGLHPVVKAKAEKVVRDMALLGHKVTTFQGFRSFAEQDALYAQGRTKPGAVVTNARGGDSYHNYGLAVDIVFVVNGKPSWDAKHPWATLGKIGKSHGFQWGGDWQAFKDLPHLQYTNYTLDDLKNNRVNYSKIT
jgi:peptidoglycan L-alanyl-D-glutamate endopeptidase CwlK